VGLAILGAAADAWLSRRRSENKPQQQEGGQQLRPRLWAVFVCTASYGLLIKGLTLTLFQYSVTILAMQVIARTENTIELVQGLAARGMGLAAAFIVTYAMVIPGIKVVLLILGQVLQHGGAPWQLRWARRCILTVQAVSKWAAPDMFAYILLLCLFRGLDKPPNLLSEMQFGLGFSCYVVFCVGSTISSLGIPVPNVPAKPREVTSKEQESQPQVRTSRRMGWPTLALVAALAASFIVLLAVGVALPVMELRLDMALLYEEKPQLKPLASFLSTLDLPELMHEVVSGRSCLLTLMADISQGSISSGLAFMMYAVFTVLLPFLDMLALLLSACRLRSSSGHAGTSDAATSAARILGKLSMLDVSVVGIVVVVLSMTSMRHSGVIVSMREGVLFLLLAVLCRYAASFAVRRALAAGRSSEEPGGRPKGGEERRGAEGDGVEEEGGKQDSNGVANPALDVNEELEASREEAKALQHSQNQTQTQQPWASAGELEITVEV